MHFILGGKYLCKTETCLKRNMLGCLGVTLEMDYTLPSCYVHVHNEFALRAEQN